jgi:hypothetical protein
MQNRDFAKADNEFGIGPRGCEINFVGYAVRTLAAPRRDNRAHIGIAQRFIEICKAFFVSASEII